MLVTRITGDCPQCNRKDCFGNVSIHGNQVLRGCKYCKHSMRILLPDIQKKIIYLDQFFFSGAFRGGEKRFVEAARRIQDISGKQLLVVPFSSIHEDETHLWRGYDETSKEGLLKFIKAASRGHKFKPAYAVERTQVLKAFKMFLSKGDTSFVIEELDILNADLHKWDDYFRIDVDLYSKDVKLIRELKSKSIERLIDVFEDWRKSTCTFADDVELELRDARKNYINSYFDYISRIARGDYNAMFDSPIISRVVESMMHCFPDDTIPEDRMKQVTDFFMSDYFANVPYHWLSARMFAILKDMVKRGAYKNRKKALNKLSGFFYDVAHIATYAPYCDAFIMDKPMAELVSDPRIGIEKKFGVKVFSLNNWDELFSWLDLLEAEMPKEHEISLLAAYP